MDILGKGGKREEIKSGHLRGLLEVVRVRHFLGARGGRPVIIKRRGEELIEK